MSVYNFKEVSEEFRKEFRKEGLYALCHRCTEGVSQTDLCDQFSEKCEKGTVGYFVSEDDEELSTEEAKELDRKYDEGKPMVGQMKKDFPHALLAVADVTRYGIEKYKKPGSWKEVENAFYRYEDALGRHDLMGAYEDYDDESGRRHLVHRAWNALATLELILMEELNGTDT